MEKKSNDNKWVCMFYECINIYSTGEDATHFFCRGCNGNDHEEYEKTLVEIKHPIHPKHPLLVVWISWDENTRKCYCCDEGLKEVFYHCSTCDFAINIVCADKQPDLSISHPKWHQHTLHWFPRQNSPTCNICALTYSTSSVYMCPPCDLVVHRRCTNLPRVIKISRHNHRIYFTFSFEQRDISCVVGRKKIDNNYGGYSCIKDNCSYVAHSRCATQNNVWDGIDLEGVPEESEEEALEPFVRISDGIIQHFSHQQQHHHLKLDKDICRDYDENKLCQACITPIYSNNLYSCTQCEFTLHEACANLSRKIDHPIHPHPLTLTLVDEIDVAREELECSACSNLLVDGFFYGCSKKKCRFGLHVSCATLHEPLVNISHKHPLFLTCKPREESRCSVCKIRYTKETFNCIECDFSLCFKCVVLPHKLRCKYDKHMLTLSYGNETGAMTSWCEICEEKIKEEERYYKCDEYCCVTLHIKCLIGTDWFIKPGSSWNMYYNTGSVVALPNNQHMTRPFCSYCHKRCPYKVVVQWSGKLFCSSACLFDNRVYSK